MSGGIIFPSSIDVTTSPSEASADAFGRQRVSLPQVVWEAYHMYDKNPLFVTEQLVGSATSVYNANSRSVEMTTTTTAGDSVIRQSRQYAFYQPGRSQLVLATGIMGPSKTNVTQRIGYFDDNNGVFFEQTGAGKFVVVRSNAGGSIVDTRIAQASWNIDPLDGTGPSGITIDWELQNLYSIDFEWLGTGRIRFGFDLEGKTTYCHEVLNANILGMPWMGTPNLPIRYSITNTGAVASPTTMSMTCAAVMSESGLNPTGKPFAADTGSTLINIAAGVTTGIIAVRPLSGRPRLVWEPVSISAMANTADSFLVRLYFAPTVTGGTWNAISGANTEVNTTFTSFTGGHIMDTAYAASQNRQINNITKSQLRPGNTVAGTSPDIILISITAFGTGNFTASLSWREFE